MHRALLSAILTLPFAVPTAGAQAQTAAPADAPVQVAAAAKFTRVHGAIRIDAVNVPFEVKIEPSTMGPDGSSIEAGGDHWEARGYDLKSVIAGLFGIDARLVDVPEGLTGASERFDVSL